MGKGVYTPKLQILSKITAIFNFTLVDLIGEDLSVSKIENESSFETIATYLTGEITYEQ